MGLSQHFFNNKDVDIRTKLKSARCSSSMPFSGGVKYGTYPVRTKNNLKPSTIAPSEESLTTNGNKFMMTEYGTNK